MQLNSVLLGYRRSNVMIPFLYVTASLYAIFFNIIPTSLVDELIIFVLFLYGCSKNGLNKEFKTIILILVFFLLYSLLWGRNVFMASVTDFFRFMKPFVAFFIPYCLGFQIKEKDKKLIRFVFLVSGFILMALMPSIKTFYKNYAAYYSCCSVAALSYLLFSDFKTKNWIITLLIISCGLASDRAKFYTEYIFIIYVCFFLHNKVRFNFKWVFLTTTLVALSIYFNWAKFKLYFIDGFEEGAVRSVFYMLTPKVIMDYFPLGPGFGTFNTESAAEYYSPLYSEYNVDHIWGMRQIDYRTSADFLKDTFYPALSQFGIMGFFFYIWFWVRRWNEAFAISFERYKLCLIIFLIIAVQNIADNSFTERTGVPYMMALGMLLSKPENSICK